jgi:ParB family chromosome partitioning protein
MDNSKRNVHNSGPLGMLVKTGQIKKIDLTEESQGSLQHVGLDGLKSPGAFFKTQSGIQFSENELVFLDPKECEPWEYANRSTDEMGDMEELIKSIRENSQLQPALVRTHPAPHDGIKYQIIFGRRRYTACLKLGFKLLVIKKDALTLQEAISCQDAENKFRKDISNYSNAVLYKKLLEDKAFKTEKELAEKLRISTSTLNDLMMYTKIPAEIIALLPNIHQLPVYLAVKIVRILAEDKALFQRIIEIAPEIGKSITTPAKLEALLLDAHGKNQNVPHRTKAIHDKNGNKLFTFKVDHKGVPSIIFQKDLLHVVNFDDMCEQLRSYVSSDIKSGRPDLVVEI